MLNFPNELLEQIIYIFLNINNEKFYTSCFNKTELDFYAFFKLGNNFCPYFLVKC